MSKPILHINVEPGGEQYLPLAKKLLADEVDRARALGVKSGSKVTQVDGVTIRVRFVGPVQRIDVLAEELPRFVHVHIPPGEVTLNILTEDESSPLGPIWKPYRAQFSWSVDDSIIRRYMELGNNFVYSIRNEEGTLIEKLFIKRGNDIEERIVPPSESLYSMPIESLGASYLMRYSLALSGPFAMRDEPLTRFTGAGGRGRVVENCLNIRELDGGFSAPLLAMTENLDSPGIKGRHISEIANMFGLPAPRLYKGGPIAYFMQTVCIASDDDGSQLRPGPFGGHDAFKFFRLPTKRIEILTVEADRQGIVYYSSHGFRPLAMEVLFRSYESLTAGTSISGPYNRRTLSDFHSVPLYVAYNWPASDSRDRPGQEYAGTRLVKAYFSANNARGPYTPTFVVKEPGVYVAREEIPFFATLAGFGTTLRKG